MVENNVVTSVADAHLEISPESTLEFHLSKNASAKVKLVLQHPDPSSSPIAYKVKTTQPRRYLVRPNQGLIKPGGVEEVTILLVDKEKDKLREELTAISEINSNKDKFLVQSVAVADPSQVEALTNYDALTRLWSTLQSSTSAGAATGIANKKLHVKHTLADGEAGAGAASGSAAGGTPRNGPSNPASSVVQNLNNMSEEQIKKEFLQFHGKYDDLVSFSVNLTAERDILNNTLEQTRRDLTNAKRTAGRAGDSSANKNSNAAVAASTGGSGVWLLLMMIASIASILGGAKLHHLGHLDHTTPHIGSILFPSDQNSQPSKPQHSSSSQSSEL